MDGEVGRGEYGGIWEWNRGKCEEWRWGNVGE